MGEGERIASVRPLIARRLAPDGDDAQSGRAYELELGHVQHHPGMALVDDRVKGGTEIGGGDAVDLAPRSEHSPLLDKSNRGAKIGGRASAHGHFRTRRCRDARRLLG